MSTFLQATAIVAFGSLIQGLVGFGVALISVPFLVALDARFVPGPMVFAGAFLTLLIAVRERQSIAFADLKWAVLGRIPGIAAALVVLASVNADGLRPLTGGLVIFGVLMTVSGLHLRPSPGTVFAAGFLSGFMGTTSSIGGPPLALVYQRCPGPELRGTLSGHFIIAASMTLLALVAAGHFGVEEIRLSFLLLPGITAGFFLSRYLVGRVDEHTFLLRAGVLILSGLAGLMNLLRPFFG